MTFIPKEAIEVIAQSIGITNLSPDVALAVAPDEAVKCMRHARRTVLRAEDVDRALKLRNVEVLAAPLPKAPIETSVATHWLAIEGVQLAIPENAPVEAPAAVSDGKRSDYREDGLSADIKRPAKHVLSRELQFYFDKIKQLTVNRSNSILFRQSLTSLATSSAIQPLVPFFTYFIADERINQTALRFPTLKEIEVIGCPQLKRLLLDSDCAKEGGIVIEGEQQWWEGLQWEDLAIRASFEPCFKECW
ncbi:hypothetical protein Patl1_04096 [Pistacia atlantica]|uniref:Uncharacterized protein n=1 Tax=Pistacia atlantica TaxID=434234 RepID=A0ACC1BSN8_9ROSI|nr:hypothetical protein Patl1_04096 [Pistacia atlantica]